MARSLAISEQSADSRKNLLKRIATFQKYIVPQQKSNYINTWIDTLK